MFVDEAFADLLRRKFGAVKWAKMKAGSRQKLIQNNWETGIKSEFDGRQRTWEITTPFECVDVKSLKSGSDWPTISLDAQDVRGVFDPTVNKIRSMIDDQVKEVLAKTGVNPKVSRGQSPLETYTSV